MPPSESENETMFERLAGKLQTAFLVTIVSLISLIFVIQFGGPQAEGCSTKGAGYVARVEGTRIDDGDLRATAALTGISRIPESLQQQLGLEKILLDTLIERTLLAKAAREIGFHVSEEEVMTRLAETQRIRVSAASSAPPFLGLRSGEIEVPVTDEDGNFDKEAARRLIQFQLRRSLKEFADAQIDETLAARMRDLLRQSSFLSRSEARARYALEKSTITLRYASFDPAKLAPLLPEDAAALEAFISAEPAAISEAYKTAAPSFKDLPPQVSYSEIVLQLGADDKAQSLARATAEEVKRQLTEAPARFAALARKHSEGLESAASGGKVPFRAVEALPEALQAALKDAKPDALIGPVESEGKLYLLSKVARREGTVAEADAKRELAQGLWRSAAAKALASRLATALQSKLSAGETPETLDNWLADELKTAFKLEELSNLSDLPALATSAPFSREERPLKLGTDEDDILRQAFRLSLEAPAPKAPLAAGDKQVVLILTAREDADFESLDADAQDSYIATIRGGAANQNIRVAVQMLRADAEARKAIRFADKSPDA